MQSNLSVDTTATYIMKPNFKGGQQQSASPSATVGAEGQGGFGQHQYSSKTIKKKSLLNFRAIKNNYVVKPTTGMSMVENEVQISVPSGNFVANSAMAAQSNATTRKNPQANPKVRASHSQFADENQRSNVGQQTHRGSTQGNNFSGVLGPVIDTNDPQRLSYAYSQERKPMLLEANSIGESGNNMSFEQSQKHLPNASLQGGDVPTSFKSNQPQQN